jgi:hypothetical protein
VRYVDQPVLPLGAPARLLLYLSATDVTETPARIEERIAQG